jgi:hypothetical protein
MNSSKPGRTLGLALGLAVVLHLAAAVRLAGYELFIYRQVDKKEAVSLTGRLTLRGEIFGQYQSPSSYPSYNDFSGPIDRWTYGFQDYLLITPTTNLLAQLVTHDRSGGRTKFDWHISLRQELIPSLVLVLGHDSDHDSDHTSYLGGKSFYTNRNYVGVEVPVEGGGLLIEPFVRFFHHTNQRTRLDLSGDKLKQETGLRVGARLGQAVTLSFQALIQSSEVFDLAQAWLGDVILRCRLTAWLEVTLGGSIWQDWGTNPAGGKQTFSKLIWGIAVPF